jgi:protein-tyrosine phosphatase
MPAVLFVCLANRSRSPIAAASFRKELIRRGVQKGWRVASAGTWTTDGLPPTPDAIVSAKRLGLNIDNHLSKVITPRMIEQADLVIVMERGQKEALQHEYACDGEKVHLLSEVATGLAYDLPDPKSTIESADVHTEINDLVQRGFEHICALVRH